MLKNANNQGTTILHTLKVDYTLGDFEVVLWSYTYWWLFRRVNGLSYSSLFMEKVSIRQPLDVKPDFGKVLLGLVVSAGYWTWV
ncbi:hypothetical protein HanRHA438_Chr10g0467711 [Helianthus annuus]|nr:hypothetical protein HanHA300_Chr10g0373911 [Helianthus annuus]KAJ0530988.1 hypothetical protein HanHA89_Chr10g0396141 [Helianthus annuus]KAJ0697843.1 hypothetical protein HanLR1_Chr10g0373561 [Helianthus annuus]KAJ0880840.1 hypothetical protein HanRHA438_Chr10g0467711 [Helianthus annuus]